MEHLIKLFGGYRAGKARLIFLVIATVIISGSLTIAKTNVKVVEENLTEMLVEETTQETTTEETTNFDTSVINVGATSVEKDIRIRFYKLDWTLHTGIKFEVDVTDSTGKTTHYVDTDMDGRIDITDVTPGNATVTMTEVEGYTYKTNPVGVKVKDHVEYTAVEHISADVATSSADDVAKKTEKSKLVDTVEYVASSKKEVKTYVLIDNSKLLVPESLNESTSEETTLNVETHAVTEAIASTTTTTTESETETTTADVSINTITTTKSTSEDTTTQAKRLYDTDGNELYLKTGNTYSPAYEADYDAEGEFYKLEISYEYTGWQNIDGKMYYYDKNHKYVVGKQVIQGVEYTFSQTGVRGGTIGIDVSKYQGTINWTKVKAAGIDFAIIRVGYRGWGSGTLVWDENFQTNIAGATKAGIKVGVYLYSQAITEAEAVEEASVCIEAVKGYKLDLPIFIDTENTGSGGKGRADNISVEKRTKVCVAFCKTVINAGYKAGVYSGKYYFNKCLNASELSNYVIWLAEWNGGDSPTYTGKYDIWQYSSSGKIDGISGNVDMNYS